MPVCCSISAWRERGAKRKTVRVDVDGFYEEPAKAWTAELVKMLTAEQGEEVPRRTRRWCPR